jgi:hypothetical protein
MTAYRGLPWRRLLTAALGAVAIFLYWSHVSERGAGQATRAPSIEVAQSQDRGWGAAVGFASERRLDEHYEKHGREFGRLTRQEYLHQAQALRDAPAGGPILENARGDGVVTRYDRETGAFIAYNPDGVIRTYFKPNDGERYFRRQAERFE